MKVRTGFVSNSSSSSFCVYKKLMNDELIQQFREIVDAHNNNYNNCNGCIYETDSYFIGEADINICDGIINFMESHKIDYACES